MSSNKQSGQSGQQGGQQNEQGGQLNEKGGQQGGHKKRSATSRVALVKTTANS